MFQIYFEGGILIETRGDFFRGAQELGKQARESLFEVREIFEREGILQI